MATTPTAATPDQAAAQAAAQGAGVSGYGSSTGTASATSAVAQQVADARSVPLDPRFNLDQITFDETVPAVQGKRGPVIERLADLMQLLQNIEQGRDPARGLRNQALAGAASRLSGRRGTLGDLEQPLSWLESAVSHLGPVNPSSGKPLLPGAPSAGDVPKSTQRSIRNQVVGEIKQALGQLGVRLPDNVTTYNAIKAYPLPQASRDRLQRLGYVATDLTNLGRVAQATPNEQQASVVPGSNGDAVEFYQNFQQQYGNGTSAYAQQWNADLQAAGLMDANDPAGAPHAAARAYQALLAKAAENKTTPDQEVRKLTGDMPVVAPNTAAARIQQIALDYGVHLSPEQATYLGNQYQEAGNVGSATDTLARQAIAQLYHYDPTTQQTGFASIIKNSIQDQFGQYGLKPSDGQIGSLVQQTLQQGMSSEYQAKDQAMSSAEEQAKMIASLAYPSVASQIKQGFNVQQILTPYLQSVQSVLGTPASALDLTDPKWTAPLRGGPDGKGLMSTNDWELQLVNDPKYGWSQSAGARQQGASMGEALRTMFGLNGPGQQFASGPNSGG